MSSSRTPFKKRKNKPFDVSPPGQTPPSPSSRPVIITYQPEQDDPMLHREDQIKDLDLTADLSSPDAAETEESDIKHHKVSPAIKKELTVLEKKLAG
ncbi:MAG TPA: hypothetical protein VMR08_01255 [Patescibacteria group bacterium]|jgi:hypothetical protein|nr:hypothetical protein [Patescibacteria group bacterium]